MNKMIAMDQYGGIHWIKGEHPGKELMEKFGTKHMERIYQDKKDGSVVSVGYKISGLWLTLFRIEPYEKPVDQLGRRSKSKEYAASVSAGR